MYKQPETCQISQEEGKIARPLLSDQYQSAVMSRNELAGHLVSILRRSYQLADHLRLHGRGLYHLSTRSVDDQ